MFWRLRLDVKALATDIKAKQPLNWLRSLFFDNNSKTELTEKCWKGYTQKGMKTMFGKRYPNCVKKTK